TIPVRPSNSANDLTTKLTLVPELSSGTWDIKELSLERKRIRADTSPLTTKKKRRILVSDHSKKKLKHRQKIQTKNLATKLAQSHTLSIYQQTATSPEVIRNESMADVSIVDKQSLVIAIHKATERSETEIPEQNHCSSRDVHLPTIVCSNKDSPHSKDLQVNEAPRDLESLLNLELTNMDEGLESNFYFDTKHLFSRQCRGTHTLSRHRKKASQLTGSLANHLTSSRENDVKRYNSGFNVQSKGSELTQTQLRDRTNFRQCETFLIAGSKATDNQVPKKLNEFLQSRGSTDFYLQQVSRSIGSTVTNSTQSSEDEERLIAVLEQPLRKNHSRSRGKTAASSDSSKQAWLCQTCLSQESEDPKEFLDVGFKQGTVSGSYSAVKVLTQSELITTNTEKESIEVNSDQYIQCTVPCDAVVKYDIVAEEDETTSLVATKPSSKKTDSLGQQDIEMSVKYDTGIPLNYGRYKNNVPVRLNSFVSLRQDCDVLVKHDMDVTVKHDRVVSAKHDRDVVAKHDRDVAVKHDRDVVAKHDRDVVAKHDRDVVAKHDRDVVAKHDRDVTAKHDRDVAAKHDRDVAVKHDRDVAAKHDRDVAAKHDRDV
ncbi:hypothetical protein BgiMline_013722, partial [Biomphalaria glabrata]